MVATSKKPHADLPEPASAAPAPVRDNLRALYDHLLPQLGKWRVDTIGGGLLTDGLIMVGEIVSEGSKDHDRNNKPQIYTKGSVPIMLLIDPLRDPSTATVYGGLKDGRYTSWSTVELGEPLHIPEPVDFVLDTGLLLED